LWSARLPFVHKSRRLSPCTKSRRLLRRTRAPSRACAPPFDFGREPTALSHRTTSRSHLTTSRSHRTTCMSHSRYSRFFRTTASGCLPTPRRRSPSASSPSRRLSFVRRPVAVEGLKEVCHGRAPALVGAGEGAARGAGEDQRVPLPVESVAQMTSSGRQMTSTRRVRTAPRRATIASRRAMTSARRVMIAARRAITPLGCAMAS
jgi:hypothetical protein